MLLMKQLSRIPNFSLLQNFIISKISENEFRSETLDLLCKMMNSKNEIPMIALIIKFILLTH